MINVGNGYFEVMLVGEIKKIRKLLEQILEVNLNMSQTLDTLVNMVTDLTNDVTFQTTVIESAVTLIDGFNAQLDAIKAQLQTVMDELAAEQVDTATLQTVVDNVSALHDTLETETANLANAVAANTPSA